MANVGYREHKRVYVYFRLKYLIIIIIINILIQYLFSALCEKRGSEMSLYISYPCSMCRYNFYEFYVFCALVMPFLRYLSQLVVIHIHNDPLQRLDFFFFFFSFPLVSDFTSLTSWYQDILNDDDDDVRRYIIVFFICYLPF